MAISDVFKFDPEYAATEEKYKGLSRNLLGSDASDSESGSGDDDGSDDSDDSSDDDEEGDENGDGSKKAADVIIDQTETNCTYDFHVHMCSVAISELTHM